MGVALRTAVIDPLCAATRRVQGRRAWVFTFAGLCLSRLPRLPLRKEQLDGGGGDVHPGIQKSCT